MTSQQIFSVWAKPKVNKSFIVYPHKKNSKKSVFSFVFMTEVQPVHTPVSTQAYGPALSQSNLSILSVFCLVYNNGANKLFNFPSTLSNLDITNYLSNPQHCQCNISKLCYEPHGHVITGDLMVIENVKLR